MTAISSTESSTSEIDFDVYGETNLPSISPSATNSFSAEEVKRDISTKSFAERVQLIRTEGDNAEYLLDGYVKVAGRSVAFCEKMQEHWLAQAARTRRDGFLATGLCAGWAMVLLFNSHPVMAALSTIAAFVFGNRARDQAYNDSWQADLWNIHPLGQLGMVRKIAYQKGFSHVYFNNLKHSPDSNPKGVLYPNEVEYLYKKYFTVFCSRFLEKHESDVLSQNNWLRLFFTFNPLSSLIMSYGLGDVPSRLKPITEDYAQLTARLKSDQEEYNQRRLGIILATEHLIASYEQERESMIGQLTEQRDAVIASEQHKRDQFLKNHPLLSDQQQAESDFNLKKVTRDSFYKTSVEFMEKDFNEKIENARQACATRLDQVREEESQQLANACTEARSLLERAQQAWNEPAPQPLTPAIEAKPEVAQRPHPLYQALQQVFSPPPAA